MAEVEGNAVAGDRVHFKFLIKNIIREKHKSELK